VENADTNQRDTKAPNASMTTGLEVNPEKIKHMLSSRYQKAGQRHSTKMASRSFEGVARTKYLGATLNR
jgi:hypothetical protein